MLAYSTINPVLLDLLNTDLVKKIYHSVILYEEENERFPAYRIGDDYAYCGQDDREIMGCYLRQTGDFTNRETTQISSAEKMYVSRIPYRLVFFNDHEKRNHDDLAAKLMNIVFAQDIEFVRYISDKTRLAQEESKLKGFNFGGNTFYAAIDIFVTVRLKKTNCEQVMNCGDIPNPIVKC